MRGAAPVAVLGVGAYLLALFGFGAKAGLVPVHVWLPEAHPAAPSPVSAMMSGVMLKTAIYGLLRVSFDLLGTPLWWWGVVALAVGLVTAAVRRALQHGADRHEAPAGLFVDREHRPDRVGIGLTLIFHAYCMEALAALALTAVALPLPRPCRLQEPAVPRHRLGAACHQRSAASASSAA